jgi:carboxymethylenebutenolidase
MEVVLAGVRGEMPIYVGQPKGDGPFPAVLVVSDALGMTTDLRNQVDWLASEGYLAAAPDLYYWGGRLRCLFSTVRQAGSGDGQIFEDFETVRSWLIDHPESTGRVGVIGFCLGGGFALLLAGNGRFDVVSSNYGGLTKKALAGLAGSCPIVGSYGGLDRSLRKEPAQISSVLREHGIPFDMKVYPDAGHSFMNDHLDSETPMWVIVTGKLIASGYHEPSANDARSRITAFFAEHLS